MENPNTMSKEPSGKPNVGTVVTLTAFFGFLMLLMELRLVTGLPISKYLAHLFPKSATTQSTILLIAGIPYYIAFLLGALRDFLRRSKVSDQTVLLIVCPMVAIVNFALAMSNFSIPILLTCLIISATGFSIIVACVQGQMADVAKRFGISGLFATLTQTVAAVAAAAVQLVAGIVADKLALKWPFIIVAGLALLILVVSFVQPRAATPTEPPSEKRDWSVLFRHRSFWIAQLIWLIWGVAPAQGTPFTNYVLNHLHLNATALGQIISIQQISFFPSLILFGVLSRFFSLRSLLWVGTLIGIFQWVPVMFVHSELGLIIWAGIFVGLSGGIATGAFFDLILRSAPRGYSGLAVTFAYAMGVIATRWGDLPGSWLYDRSGFFWCAIATAILYALILPLLPFLPSSVTAHRDGEAHGQEPTAA